MRLPEFLTKLSPIRETLAAIAAGEKTLSDAVAEKNARLSVGAADATGLALWEADYGLSTPSGSDLEARRAAVRTAMAGGHTLTPAYLAELCVTVGGAERGEVEEDFANWTVTAVPVGSGCVPATGPLGAALERLKPAHIRMEVVPCGELALLHGAALTGGVFMEIWE